MGTLSLLCNIIARDPPIHEKILQLPLVQNPHAPSEYKLPTYNKTGETSSPSLSPTIKMFP